MPWAGSGRVTGVGVPPVAGTRIVPRVPPKRITFSLLQERPSAFAVRSQIVSAGPPATSIFRSLPWLANAINRLSGDHAVKYAPSVPDKGCDSKESSVRIHKPCALLPEPVTLKTSRRPSGDTENAPTLAP